MSRGASLVPLVAGIAGPAVVGGCAAVTALAYRGTAGQPYSPLSHWVSELGEEGVSGLAAVFNAGAVVGGACLSALMLALARARGGRLARIYGRIGVIGGVAGSLVGLFPMNRILSHAIVSTSFFNLTALAIALASIDFGARPDGRFGAVQAGLGAVSTAAYLAFGVVAIEAIREQGLAALEPPIVREEISLLTTFEWASLLSIMAWVMATAAGWARDDS
ncbi:MAG TPA: DUF998 domain-containing protein [Candidatus Limnocylindrales bacterium]|nr:DUF998 domain-containing protein [Candidatus Limnocylindrales bacterium]